MKNKIINIIILTLLVITSLITLYALKHKEKGLEKLVVFGQEIDIIEGKHVYEIGMKKAKIRKVNNGCEYPIEVIYNGKKPLDSMQYLVNGEKEAYFKLNFKEEQNNKNYVSTYDLYVHVYLEEPLVIECEN